MLTQAGDGGTTIITDGGCYRVRLGDAWLDIEVAANAVDRAEGAWRHADIATRWSEATVAAAIVRRPLLPGELGIDPSAETTALYLDVLRTGTPRPAGR